MLYTSLLSLISVHKLRLFPVIRSATATRPAGAALRGVTLISGALNSHSNSQTARYSRNHRHEILGSMTAKECIVLGSALLAPFTGGLSLIAGAAAEVVDRNQRR